MNIYIHISVYIYTHTQTYIYTYIHTYIHTYTHIYIELKRRPPGLSLAFAGGRRSFHGHVLQPQQRYSYS